MSTLRDRLKKRLEAVRITQTRLAADVGLDNPQNVSLWMSRGKIPYERLYKVAEILECAPEWLQHGVGSEAPADQRDTTIDAAALEYIIAGSIEAVREVGLDWNSKQIAKLVTQLYELWLVTGEHANFPQAARLLDISQKK